MSNPVYEFSWRWTKCEKAENFDDIDFIKDTLKLHDCDKFIFQLEDTKDNLHYQGYAHVKTKTRAKTLAVALNAHMFGIEVQPTSTAGRTALKKYCMKTESRVDGPWADHKVYMGQDLPHQLFPWQQQVIDWISGPASDRIIYWIYNPAGNAGKSKLAKLLSFRYNGAKLGYADASNLLYLASKRRDADVYCIDLTRTKPAEFSETSLYSVMEDLKGGHWCNLKYDCEEILREPPHMVVFANHKPKWDLMSRDRWSVWLLENGWLSQIHETPFSGAVAGIPN